MKIGVVGCAGRMGRMLVQEIAATAGCTLAGGTARAGGAAVGEDIGALAGLTPQGIVVVDDPATLFAAADAVIDFTTPDLAERHAGLAAQERTAYILGTTGLDEAQQAVVAAAAAHAPIVQAPSMLVGVNLLFALVGQAAARLDDAFDIEVLEMHHRHKVDAPSGTALGLGLAAAAGRGVALPDVWQKVRDGHAGVRPRGAIGFAALRGGDVIGDHTVVFAADGERIELTHRAMGRQLYAKGAVRAARWAAGRPPGLYSMRDVLGL